MKYNGHNHSLKMHNMLPETRLRHPSSQATRPDILGREIQMRDIVVSKEHFILFITCHCMGE